MNKIFCSLNYNNYIESIVIAPTKRDAEIYWQGKGIFPHTVREIDPNDLKTPLGILEILKTEKVRPNIMDNGTILAVGK